MTIFGLNGFLVSTWLTLFSKCLITSLCYAVAGSFRMFKKIFCVLEYCVILISYLLKKRKLMFLRQMLHLEEHYMFYRPGIAQLINSTKGNNFQKFKKTFNFYSLKIEGSHNSVISFEHLIFTWSGSNLPWGTPPSLNHPDIMLLYSWCWSPTSPEPPVKEVPC